MLLTQILMLGPAAAQSQYLLGLKQSEFRMSPPSSVYRCFPSFKSHSMAIPSLPPDAHREPSGDTVTQLRYPVCPIWFVLRRQLVRFQTLKELILKQFINSHDTLESLPAENIAYNEIPLT